MVFVGDLFIFYHIEEPGLHTHRSIKACIAPGQRLSPLFSQPSDQIPSSAFQPRSNSNFDVEMNYNNYENTFIRIVQSGRAVSAYQNNQKKARVFRNKDPYIAKTLKRSIPIFQPLEHLF